MLKVAANISTLFREFALLERFQAAMPVVLVVDAQTILGRCRQRVGLQFDLYHVARMGLDPAAELKPLIAGAYTGWLSAEYIPLAATAAGLEWLGSWRRGALRRV